MIGQAFRGMLSGFGPIVAPSVTTTGAITAGGRTTSAGFSSSIAGDATTPAFNKSDDTNTGIYFAGADAVSVATGGGAPLNVVSGGANISSFTATSSIVNLGPLYLREMAAPAGLTDYAVLYGVVDGGSKTDLDVIFQTGVAIKIAEEA